MSLQGGIMFVIIGRLIITPIIRLSTIFTWLIALGEHIIKLIFIKIKNKIKDGKITTCNFNKDLKVNNCLIEYDSETKIYFEKF